jgi:hypothetical protein
MDPPEVQKAGRPHDRVLLHPLSFNAHLRRILPGARRAPDRRTDQRPVSFPLHVRHWRSLPLERETKISRNPFTIDWVGEGLARRTRRFFKGGDGHAVSGGCHWDRFSSMSVPFRVLRALRARHLQRLAHADTPIRRHVPLPLTSASAAETCPVRFLPGRLLNHSVFRPGTARFFPCHPYRL